MNLHTLLLTAHCLGWAVYVGGSVTMELVLRHAQQYMRPSQVAVVCQASGKRYRWWSFVALMVLLASGIPLASRYPGGFDLATASGKLIGGISLLWLAQMAVLGLLAFRVHPDMHARADARLSDEEFAAERRRVGQAIQRMDRLLRIELGGAIFALLLGAALHQPTLISG